MEDDIKGFFQKLDSNCTHGKELSHVLKNFNSCFNGQNKKANAAQCFSPIVVLDDNNDERETQQIMSAVLFSDTDQHVLSHSPLSTVTCIISYPHR